MTDAELFDDVDIDIAAKLMERVLKDPHHFYRVLGDSELGEGAEVALFSMAIAMSATLFLNWTKRHADHGPKCGDRAEVLLPQLLNACRESCRLVLSVHEAGLL